MGGIGCVIDGCPPGMRYRARGIRTRTLARRATGQDRHNLGAGTNAERHRDPQWRNTKRDQARRSALLVRNTDARQQGLTTASSSMFRPAMAGLHPVLAHSTGIRDRAVAAAVRARRTTMRWCGQRAGTTRDEVGCRARGWGVPRSGLERGRSAISTSPAGVDHRAGDRGQARSLLAAMTRRAALPEELPRASQAIAPSARDGAIAVGRQMHRGGRRRAPGWGEPVYSAKLAGWCTWSCGDGVDPNRGQEAWTIRRSGFGVGAARAAQASRRSRPRRTSACSQASNWKKVQVDATSGAAGRAPAARPHRSRAAQQRAAELTSKSMRLGRHIQP